MKIKSCKRSTSKSRDMDDLIIWLSGTNLHHLLWVEFKANMSFGENKRDISEEEDEEKTVVGDGSDPMSLVYSQQEGSLSREGTLVDGNGGSGSSSLNKFKKKRLNTSVQQLRYNENKLSLDRAIVEAIELLYDILSENKHRPIYYPAEAEDDSSLLLNSLKAHIALVRSNQNLSEKSVDKAKISKDIDETPELKVLRLNIKLGHSNTSNGDLIGSLDKSSIAAILEQKLNQQVRYLSNLKDRIDDTSSKVFVTGDLNAGKSTFCNALLRRKILPEDQQPCTAVFCEVIDANKENKGVEEVHAIFIDKEYDVNDESTYEIHELKDLENLVYECDKYKLIKVYVLDGRSFHESLLHNGVIDIRLIDAPGLNMDLYQTTQVFSRQEEIDLVVFVVNSENHFTLSAKEFIAAAAAEKRYVFIVANKFDNIKDKERCSSKILEQVKGLTPETHKNANEFVHFISSSDALERNGGGGGDGGDDGPNNDNDRGYPDFDNLEASLRKFVLEKRAISKLFPAKNYLINLLSDLEALASLNQKIYLNEIKKRTQDLEKQILPKYENALRDSSKINDQTNALTEKVCSDVYDFTRNEILDTINNFGDSQVLPYMGLQYVYEYARSTQQVMINTIVSAVEKSEGYAKERTADGVDKIIKYGQSFLSEDFLNDKVFKSDLMFSRKHDMLKKNLSTSIEVSDFFDPSWESCLMWLGVPEGLVNLSKKQLEEFNPVNLLTSFTRSTSAIRDNIPRQVTLHTIYSSTKLLTAGALIRKVYSMSFIFSPSTLKKISGPLVLGVVGFSVFYLINDIPNAYPRKQARKLKKKVVELDYVHLNADRIAKGCRLVLNYPSRQVLTSLQTSIDKTIGAKQELEEGIKESEAGYRYFKSFYDRIGIQKRTVEAIDLESLNNVD